MRHALLCPALLRHAPLRHALAMPAALAAAAASAVLLAAVPASATVITYKSWYSAANGPDPASTPQAYTTTDWNGVAQKILVPQFDPSLGTLTAATLSLYADANASGAVKNTGTSSATVKSYNAALRVRLLTPSAAGATGPGIDSPATTATPYLLEAVPPLVTIPAQTLAVGASVPFNLTGTANTSAALDLFAAGYVASFQGTGNATLPVFTGTRVLSSVTGGNLTITQTTSARAEAVVTYTYTAAVTPVPVPVPEPMSAALLAAPLLGLGLLRRR